MSPPAASVDSRAPSDLNFDFNCNPPSQDGNPNYERSSFNTGASSYVTDNNASNAPFSFSVAGRTGPRSRPRLFKQRRSCKSTTLLSGDAGVNPFRSVASSTVDQLNCFSFGSDSNKNIDNDNNNDNDDSTSVHGAQFDELSFVFGGSNSKNKANGFHCSMNNGSNNNSHDKNVIGGQINNVGFVFGGSNSNNKAKVDAGKISNDVTAAAVDGSKLGNDRNNVSSMKNDIPEKKDSSFNEKTGGVVSNGVKQENGKVEDVAFCFRATDQVDLGNVKHGENGAVFGLWEDLKKLNIESNQQGSFGGNVGVSGGGDNFVFTSGGVSSDVPGESSVSWGSSVPWGSENSSIDLNGDDKSIDAAETSGLGTHIADDNVFVFGSSGRSTGAGGLNSQSSSCLADGGSVEDVLQSLFSSSSLGTVVGSGKAEACSVSDEKKADCGFASIAQCMGASSRKFTLPKFDAPLSFSANLSSEFGRKGEASVRTRGLRDKHLKKTTGKAKHSTYAKQEPVERPSSAKSVTQDQEAAECYSPMDFSPYEDEETTASNNKPLTGQEASGKSTGVCTDTQSNLEFTSNGLGATTSNSSSGLSANVNRHDSNEPQFAVNSDVASEGQEKYAFTISNSGSLKRHQKKYRMKAPCVAGSPGTTSIARGSSMAGTPLYSKVDGANEKFYVSMSKGKHEAKGNTEQSCESAFSSAEKACDKWRKRGNEAYERGDLSKAEDYYSFGVDCIPPGDALGVVFTPLVRCYSNRAATRMARGRVREAIQDCLMAVKLDPTFHRAQMRAANCYLQLGELEDAMKCFGNIMESLNGVCLDRKVFISASEGIQKSQNVIELSNRAAELLRVKTSEPAASALKLISEAMSVSTYSEKLLEMKAEALCLLRMYDEAIVLCRQTLDFAEKNFTAASSPDHGADGFCSNMQHWRQHVLYKCYFHLGKLEMALDLIEKSGAQTQESTNPLALTIGELLREKSSGNTAFQSGNHVEAIEHYTTAILSSMESRPFAAICFCNRAAAHQALGHIADAISDCSLAIALDENYPKAVSRRATLHEMIRDYRQAASDLQRLVSLLEKQSVEKSKQSGSGNGKELRQVRHRLSVMEEEAKRDIPLDLYLILGVNKSDQGSEIKKAYRKAALRHHPDKACQSLVRTDAGDEGRHWKDIAELVHKDSDRLFKMIGEAYAVLSDPTKREEYDEEEDMRKALKESNNNRSRRHSEHVYQGYSYPFERSCNRRNWQDSYRTYSSTYRRW